MRHILLFILSFGLGCQPKKKNIELEVIKSTLLDVIGTGYYEEPPPLPPKKARLPDSSSLIVEPQIGIFIGDELVMSDSLIKADSLERVAEQQRRFDSVTLAYEAFDWDQYNKDSITWIKTKNEPREPQNIILLVSDSLIGQVTGLSNPMNVIQWRDSYQQLVNKLEESDLASSAIDFNNFRTVDRYQIEPTNYKPTDDDRVVSTLILSRVVFNTDKTRAAYFYQQDCGLLCGYGYMVFAELTDNGWLTSDTSLIWIS